MPVSRDLEWIRDVALGRDPAFAPVAPGRLPAALQGLATLARANDPDRFLLQAMRLVALAGNGHTRLIPNAAIRTLPLRLERVVGCVIQDSQVERFVVP